MSDIVLVIDGHDWRYTGDGWRWLDAADPRCTGTWADLVRIGYSRKECMTCKTIAPPSDVIRPCNEVWSDMTGYPSAANREGPIYRPALPR